MIQFLIFFFWHPVNALALVWRLHRVLYEKKRAKEGRMNNNCSSWGFTVRTLPRVQTYSIQAATSGASQCCKWIPSLVIGLRIFAEYLNTGRDRGVLSRKQIIRFCISRKRHVTRFRNKRAQEAGANMLKGPYYFTGNCVHQIELLRRFVSMRTSSFR